MAKISDLLNSQKISRLDAHKPRLATSDPDFKSRELVKSVLPKGANLSYSPSKRRTGSIFSGSSTGAIGENSIWHTQRPYEPKWESPDRLYYPTDRVEANEHWRMFHKYDPIFGTAIEMYTEMLVSDFDIVLENADDPGIVSTLEQMCEDVNLQDVLRMLIKEFLVIGEVFPHCFFDEETGLWSYVGFHNPDFIEVLDSPIIDMEPIIKFVPDDGLREMLLDGSEEARTLRNKLPAEFVSKIMSGQKIRLSPVNCSYIARKLHPYDERGTSMASRLWRIWMVEDAVYNSTIATYRRSASPINVVKMGDPAQGWIPGPDQQDQMVQMLAQAELDPHAFIVTHYGVNYEAWGSSERAVTISKENATIETIKLQALGLSKSFTSGDTTYANAKSGLQVFLRRLLSLRQYIESVWLYPKFFQPIVEVNEWYRTTQSEVNHNFRIKQSSVADEDLYVRPKIVWKNNLDPKVDEDLMKAFGALKQFGVPIAKSTIAAAASMDWKSELEKTLKEFKEEKEIKENTLGVALTQEFDKAQQMGAGGGAKPPGGAGGGAMPPGAKGGPAKPKGDASTPPGSADPKGLSEPMDDAIENPADIESGV